MDRVMELSIIYSSTEMYRSSCKSNERIHRYISIGRSIYVSIDPYLSFDRTHTLIDLYLSIDISIDVCV